MTEDPTWDFWNAASKRRILEVLAREMDDMMALVDDPSCWEIPTACEGWQVRDMVGHLIDATEGYLSGFEIARSGDIAPPAVGVARMAEASDVAARAFRHVPREDLVDRLRRASSAVMGELEALSDEDWTGLLVADPYLGPLPATIIATGLLGGYTVHGWDVREGLGATHSVQGDAADLLVPFVYLLWQATADMSSLDAPFAIGVRTTGRNGGDTRFDVSAAGLQLSGASIDDCAAILELDPATLVLTAYGRVNAGTIRGDGAVASRFRSLFVSI
jgi:uncharacterized protein (TIGR03083 family)